MANAIKMYFFADVENMSEEERNNRKLPDWRKVQLDVPEHILPMVKLIRNDTSVRLSDLKTIIKIMGETKQ